MLWECRAARAPRAARGKGHGVRLAAIYTKVQHGTSSNGNAEKCWNSWRIRTNAFRVFCSLNSTLQMCPGPWCNVDIEQVMILNCAQILAFFLVPSQLIVRYSKQFKKSAHTFCLWYFCGLNVGWLTVGNEAIRLSFLSTIVVLHLDIRIQRILPVDKFECSNSSFRCKIDDIQYRPYRR